ncbi:quinone-dependent dihydroorotate dehydrogenase [Paracoccaceae bacterium GXU_MW_L88]
MKLIERVGLSAMHRLDPEKMHRAAIHALKYGVAPMGKPVESLRLRTELAGLSLPNPLGVAAGFDKNAEVPDEALNAGFGFVELGAVTPRPQPGNPKPRLFRLMRDSAVINRFGFNNDGMEAVAARLAARQKQGVIGLNLGANKDSADRAADFGKVLARCGPFLDFATVNVSSPNTEKLRDLQGADALRGLLAQTRDVRDGLTRKIPLFVKIAPDLSDADIADVARVAQEVGIDGIIATNTTLSRDGLTDKNRDQAGGLSGVPLFQPSTRVLARLAVETGDAIPLIGVGGIASAEDAYAKIKAGASAVQLYTALVYHGLSLVSDILSGLDKLLAEDGYERVDQAVGVEREAWASMAG